ncbi:MAG: SdrD B-like domain-containing protein [Caldilineaceae bacterium]
MRPQLWAPAAPALLIGLLAAMLAALFTGLPTTLVPTASAADCGGSAITGTAFRDYNANGTRDALEPGIAGIVVTATGANGSSVTCTTTANGTYGIDPAGGFPVRMEFTLPVDGSLAFLSPGPAGTGSRTTVTFVASPGAGVNVGFVNPVEYCGAATPDLIAACPAFGEQNDNASGLFRGAAVLYKFPYTAGSSNLGDQGAVAAPAPAILATARQIGTTAGLAWNPRTQTLYAAAFMKRHAGFGPSGPGAIYQWTAAGPSLFYNFGAVAGVDPHPTPSQTCLSPTRNDTNTNLNCWLHDTNAFDAVGKVGFGQLLLGPDFATLYAVNLADRTLMAIPLANPAAYTATAIPVPASCPAADFRPFALGANDGVLYVGAVCTAESTQNRSNLRAYVLAYANGAFRPTPAFDFTLIYNRGLASRQWQYWLNRTSFNPTDPLQSTARWAQPWLTGIAFDHGDMILTVRDRTGDQFGVATGGPDPLDPTNYNAFSQGDLLRACAVAGGGWSLESNGTCGAVTTAGTNNGQGPGGGEYYYQDRQAQPLREETSWGSLVQIPGRTEVAVTAYGPYEAGNATGDGGVKWYANATGAAVRLPHL